MGRMKQSQKKVASFLNDWNRPRFMELEEFCKRSFKVNKNKVGIYASVVTDYVFARYVDLLGQRAEYSPLGTGVSREKRGEIGHMLREAKSAMEKIRDAGSKEELFLAQKRLKEICVTFVDEGLTTAEGKGKPGQVE